MKNHLLPGFFAILTAVVFPLSTASQQASTPRQKEHSKLYKNYGHGRKIRDLAADRQNVFVTVSTGDQHPYSKAGDLLAEIACSSDAVVIGRLLDESSALNEDETFIFSDYTLAIEEILKNNPRIPIQNTSQIVITRPGGTLKIEGQPVQAEINNFEPFRLGSRYLLFLKFVPMTGGYQAFGRQSFELRDGQFFPSSYETEWIAKAYKQDAAVLISETRTALAAVCK